MDDEVVVQEGGADAAALLLRLYDPASRTWSLRKDGEFWDAVDAAHRRGHRGFGRRIAVVDSGFHHSLPALADAYAWPNTGADAPTNHGTGVALLVREVAPDASVELYTASLDGKLRISHRRGD